MLSYNDANLSHSQPSQATCVVCHDLTPPERIIWHEAKLGGSYRGYPQHNYPSYTRLVPICIDCADLFHDVKPSKLQGRSS